MGGFSICFSEHLTGHPNILTNAGIPEQNIEMKWYGKSRFGEFKYTDKSEYRRVTISVK